MAHAIGRNDRRLAGVRTLYTEYSEGDTEGERAMTATARDFATRHGRRGSAGAMASTPAAGDGLLHPAVLGAIVILILNDHLLKPMQPGLVTGKLSDIAGMLLAPILAVAAVELACAARGRARSPGRRWLVGICALTAVAFGAVKTTAVGAMTFGAIIGIGQWAGGVVLTPVLGPPPPAAIAQVVADPTDLVAILAVGPALILSLRRRAMLSVAGWR